jgi:hypothetical protein
MLSRTAQSLQFHKAIDSLSAMKLSTISSATLLSASIVAVVCGALSGTFSPVSREASERNKKPVLKYIRRVTSSCDIAVELYYVTNCSASRDAVRDEPIPFPFVKIQPAPEGSTGITAIRKIFRNDNNVRVTQLPTGTVRVTIGKVPTGILDTKISALTLDEYGRYNPIQAIRALMITKQMEAAMGALKLKPVDSLASTVADVQPDLPHFPSLIRNMTVEQILDRMAKMWDGPVMYGICENATEPNGKRLFSIDSAQDVMPKGYWRRHRLFRPE